ncbi:hypothetical protein ALC57_06552 [Trachymyrmex cornetzi]|uniref:CCHC-type domain-containing protein n=1 Tax=Trachymyrmex cornetzi TaxID=471704 RepID=A0A151J8A4_9HYME|nr:hypothetical protein ALC57_06552 [Trachymyrmex cornetzi]
MRLARGKISLEEMNIENTRIRRAQAGGLLIEIPGGDEAGAKAEALVGRLREVLAESTYKDDVSVVRPVRRAEIRLIDIDQSVTSEEVIAAVASRGQVPTVDIRTGPFRLGRGGINTVWVQYPLQCANRLISEGRVRIGRSSADVVALAKRRLQCFRCLAVGHTRANCQSLTDRSTWCFQCGSDGHRASGCRLPPKCPVCASRGLGSGHRAGAPECIPFNGRGQAPNGDDTRLNTERTSVGADRGAPTPVDEQVSMEVDG